MDRNCPLLTLVLLAGCFGSSTSDSNLTDEADAAGGDTLDGGTSDAMWGNCELTEASLTKTMTGEGHSPTQFWSVRYGDALAAAGDLLVTGTAWAEDPFAEVYRRSA